MICCCVGWVFNHLYLSLKVRIVLDWKVFFFLKFSVILWLTSHDDVVDTGGPGVVKDQGIPGNPGSSLRPRPIRGQEGEMWPIRGELRPGTDQSAAIVRIWTMTTPHRQRSKPNTGNLEKYIFYSIKVNWSDWYCGQMVKYKYLIFMDDKSQRSPNVPV